MAVASNLMTSEPAFISVSDHAVLVQYGTTISDELLQSVQALDRALALQPPHGVLEVTPALVNLLIVFDPMQTDHDDLVQAVRPLLSERLSNDVKSTVHTVEVCYDPALGPDLSAVANSTGMSEANVANMHAGADYLVGMYGFAPGYAYLAGTPEAIRVPRKKAPVRDVPAGSVIIAGAQCLITTLEMPTGWSIIGRSPVRVLRPEHEKPFLFEVGDQIRFKSIDMARYQALMNEQDNG
ncbi:MAG: allophanate hydrolase subunit 1 [Granulosicoccus sp.]